MRTEFGRWGGHIETFDIYEDWRDTRLAAMEAGVNPRTREPITNMAVFEASPDSKADFATFMWEPVQANFYAGYDYVAAQWNRYVSIESVNSFDEVRIKGINSLTGVGYVGESGEYPGLRRTFRPDAAIIVDTYGAEYGMTRKLLRSNGIDKIVQRNPMDLGSAMGDFVTRLIIAMLVANPNAPDGAPMLSSGRGNLVVDDVTEDTVTDAAVWLRTRTDPDNRPITANISVAAVQNDRVALKLRQIINSQLVQYLGVATTATAPDAMGRGTSNPIAGSDLIPADGIVIDPWLPDANNVTFFADPDKLPAYVVAFLDGQQQPMLGMADATVMHLSNSSGSGSDPYSFHGDKIEYKTRQDVGVSPVEPLGTYQIAPA